MNAKQLINEIFADKPWPAGQWSPEKVGQRTNLFTEPQEEPQTALVVCPIPGQEERFPARFSAVEVDAHEVNDMDDVVFLERPGNGFLDKGEEIQKQYDGGVFSFPASEMDSDGPPRKNVNDFLRSIASANYHIGRVWKDYPSQPV